MPEFTSITNERTVSFPTSKKKSIINLELIVEENVLTFSNYVYLTLKETSVYRMRNYLSNGRNRGERKRAES